MNKIITLVGVFFTAFAMTLAACGKENPSEPVPNNSEDEIPVTPNKPDEPDSPDNDSKTLVVYYSHSGNTQTIDIRDALGCDIVRIETVNDLTT